MEEKLIELVKIEEVLYNKNKKGYKNIRVKDEIWKKIAKELEIDGEYYCVGQK